MPRKPRPVASPAPSSTAARTVRIPAEVLRKLREKARVAGPQALLSEEDVVRILAIRALAAGVDLVTV